MFEKKNSNNPHQWLNAMKTLTGKPAVPFKLKDSDGKEHHLEDYKGKWLLLVFHRHLG